MFNTYFIQGIDSQVLKYILIFGLSIVLLKLIKSLLVLNYKNKYNKIQSTFHIAVSILIETVKIPLVIIIFGQFVLSSFVINEGFSKFYNILFQASITLQGVLIVTAAVKFVLDELLNMDEDKSPAVRTLYSYLVRGISLFVWVVAFILFLSNIGYNATSLIASLGIGGVAIALAVQGILKDLFSGVMILLNKPFQIGDYIELSPKEKGTVEKIGFRTTTIRTMEKTELLVPNDNLLSSRIINYRSRNKRRVNFKLNLDLSTSNEKIKLLEKEIIALLLNEEKVETENIKVFFESFSECGIIIDIVFYLTTTNTDEYLSIKNNFNFKLKEILGKNNVMLYKSSLASIAV